MPSSANAEDEGKSGDSTWSESLNEVCFVLNQAIVECFQDVRPAVYKSAMWVLREALTARELLQKQEEGGSEQVPVPPTYRRTKSRAMERIMLTSPDELVHYLLHRVRSEEHTAEL